MDSSRCTIIKLILKKIIIIQNQVKTEIGLMVDQPKLGSGILNYGNIALCFFYNPNWSSNITVEQLMYRLAVFLQVSCVYTKSWRIWYICEGNGNVICNKILMFSHNDYYL